MPKESTKKQKPIKGVYSYELDKYVPGDQKNVKQKKENVLDEIIKSEEEELAMEAKRIRVKTYIAKQTKELKALEGETGSTEPTKPSAGAGLLSYMIGQGMTPEKANAFVKGLDNEAIAKLQMLSSSPTGQNALLPFLLVAKRPETSTKDLLDLQTKYFDKALEIAEIRAKPEPKPTVQGDTISLMRDMLGEIRKEREARLEDKIGVLEKEIRESRFDPKAYIASLREQAETLGYSRGSGGTSELDIKLENMRESHDLRMHETNLELQKWMLEKEMERDKWTMLGGLFRPTASIFAQPAQDAMRNLGRKASDQLRPQQQRRVKQAPKTSTELTGPCHSCGKTIIIKPPYPTEIVCSNCGELNKVELTSEQQPRTP